MSAATETSANASPAAAAPSLSQPVQQQQQQSPAATQQRTGLTPDQLELVRRDLEALNKRVEQDFGARTDLDEKAYFTALELRARYADTLERSALSFSQWPLGVNAAIGKLDSVLMKTNTELKQFLDETNKDAESNAVMTRYLASPQEFRPIVQQVMASRSALFSQKEAEKRIQEERVAALEKKYADLNEEKERAVKRAREAEESVAVAASKRSRFETPSTPQPPLEGSGGTQSVIASNASSLPAGAVVDDYWNAHFGTSPDVARSLPGWTMPSDAKTLEVIHHVRRATNYATSAGMVAGDNTASYLPRTLQR